MRAHFDEILASFYTCDWMPDSWRSLAAWLLSVVLWSVDCSVLSSTIAPRRKQSRVAENETTGGGIRRESEKTKRREAP
jgi:hypothetical protein